MNKVNQNVTNGKPRKEVFHAPKLIEKFAELNKRKAILRLVVLLGLTTAFALQIPSLKFDYDFNSFFPKNDEDLNYYEELNAEFGEFNDFLFLVLKSDSPRDSSALKIANSTIKGLKSWSEILDIKSPFDATRIQVNPFGINQIKLISPNKNVSKRVIEENNLDGKFFGREQKSMMLIVRHKPFMDNLASDAFMIKLRAYLDQMYADEYIISGKVQMQYDFTRKLEQELSSLLLLASLFVVLVLAILFRTFKGIFLPLLTLIMVVTWTMGFIAITGKSIDVLIVIIPAILLIVALSDVIHFVHKYDELRRAGGTKEQGLKGTVIFIGKATFLTSVTTAIGFLSLCVIPINPIRDFGLYTAIGVIFAFSVTFLLLPSLLYLMPKPIERDSGHKSNWKTQIDRFFLLVLKNRRRVAWIISLTSLAIISGAYFLRSNTPILVGFQKGEPELKEVAFFDQNYDGYKPFEIGIELTEKNDLFNLSTLKEIEKIEAYISAHYNVKHIESPLTLIQNINAGIYGGSINYTKLPLEKDLRRVKKLYNAPKLKSVRSTFQSSDGNTLRIIGRSKDIGSAQGRVLNTALTDFLESEVNTQLLTARLTGTSYLIDKTDNYISGSLVKGLAVAVASVSIFLFAFFRSWRIVLYSLLPNLLPILILFGIMGYLNIDLNISTAVIFTVAFGVAVDDSIHLLARYYLERQRLGQTIWALKRSISGTGKSIIITSLVLCAGFSLFLTSGLSSPYYLGFFIVITAVIALILDLTLLPILILSIEKRIKGRQG